VAAVVEHHLSKAGEVLIPLPGQIGERHHGGATLPYALCVPPLCDGSCARLALLPYQGAEHLYTEPVANAPVADISLIKEAREPGQLGAPVQCAFWQKDLLQEEDACELVLRVLFFEQHQGQILLLSNGEVLSQLLFLEPGMYSRPDIFHLDAAEGGSASEVLRPPLTRGWRCARIQPLLQPGDSTAEHRLQP